MFSTGNISIDTSFSAGDSTATDLSVCICHTIKCTLYLLNLFTSVSGYDGKESSRILRQIALY